MFVVIGVAAFCGFTGLLFGGTPGLVIGALIGYGLSYGFRQLVVRRGQTIIQTQYFNSAFAMMGHVCRSDSAITGDEIWAANKVFDRLQLTGEDRDNARAAFERGRAEDFNRNVELSAMRRVAGGHRTLLPVFLQLQAWAMTADGELHDEGRMLLSKLASGLYVAETEIDRLEAMLRGEGGLAAAAGHSLDDAYTVLGVDSSASDDDVRKAYRGLLSQHTADTLVSQGMPECMRPIVEERSRQIEQAYQAIGETRQQAA